jgi:ketosteroid isomerase-like protein
MSPENVEVVRRLFEAWNSSGLAGALSAFDPKVEWSTPDDDPDAGTYRGLEAVAAFLQGWADSFEDFSGEAQEFIEAGDRVVVPLIVSGRPRGSSHFVTVPDTQVLTVRDGNILEVREYRTKAEALEAVGLSA